MSNPPVPKLTVQQLTTAQKAALTSGGSLWSTKAIPGVIDELILCDGPHGVRRPATNGEIGFGTSRPATCFPPAVGLSASWNPQLARRVGVALGVEARGLGVDVLLGPGLNIKRSPLGGRNFEYFSEDPHVTAQFGIALVEGIQSQGVAATIKHFAVNNQETDRMRVSADVDERTLREIYLSAFEAIVRSARPWAVMCSYNKVNGVYASQNDRLLNTILRDEWGFDGLVMSDWGAVNDRVEAVRAGLDLEMPPTGTDAEIVAAVAAGSLDETLLDQVVARMQQLAERTARPIGADGFAAGAPMVLSPGVIAEHDELARAAAAESIVLLKNEAGLLPLPTDGSARIAVIGEFARTPRYQGGGSSMVVATRVHSALDAVTAIAAEGSVRFAPGFALDSSTAESGVLAEEAVQLAAESDVAVVFLGVPEGVESEGFDRVGIDLPPGQLDLLDRIVATGTPVAVILSNGGVLNVGPWRDQVAALLEGWLLGQAGGAAVADVVFGAVNPSGRLTETIPLRLADTPSYLHFPGRDSHVPYGEGVFVGYRYFDTVAAPVAYPFGHGLSYTTFDYRDLAIVETGTDRWTVEFTVVNTGDRAGAEVAQLYVGVNEPSPTRPAHELRGFAKVFLAAGRSERVTLPLTGRDLATWNVARNDWSVTAGAYIVQIGASSRDLRLTAVIDSPGDGWRLPLTPMSTLEEWRADPVGGPALRAQLDRSASALTRSPQMMEFFAQMPLVKLGMLGIDVSGLTAAAD